MHDPPPGAMPQVRIRRICALAIAAVLLGLALTGSLDQAGREYSAASLKRALLTYGVARLLNGVISVAQGTSVALEPAGVGVHLTPGEILDPINDLVEQFSAVALLAATALGVLRVLQEIAAWLPLTVALVPLLLGCLYLAWTTRPAALPGARVLWVTTGVVLLIRFAAPAAGLTSAAVYHLFLADRYQQATAELEHTSTTLRSLNDDEQAAILNTDRSVFERARDALSAAGHSLDVGARMRAFTAAANVIAENTIDLIVVFVIETLLVPLAFLWLVFAAARRLLTALFERTPR